MHRQLAAIALTIGLVAAACGDDADLSTGAPPPAESTSRSSPSGDVAYPIAELTVTVLPDGPDGPASTYRLACLADTAVETVDGGSRDGTNRCLALADATIRERLTSRGSDERICTQVYGGPQTARLVGTVENTPVDTEIHRRDGCGIADWDLLAPLLAPPGG